MFTEQEITQAVEWGIKESHKQRFDMLEYDTHNIVFKNGEMTLDESDEIDEIELIYRIVFSKLRARELVTALQSRKLQPEDLVRYVIGLEGDINANNHFYADDQYIDNASTELSEKIVDAIHKVRSAKK